MIEEKADREIEMLRGRTEDEAQRGCSERMSQTYVKLPQLTHTQAADLWNNHIMPAIRNWQASQ